MVVWRVKLVNYSEFKLFVRVHTHQDHKPLLELGLLLATAQQLTRFFGAHLRHFGLHRGRLRVFSVEQRRVDDRLSGALRVVVLEEEVRAEKVHEANVDVVFHAPDPSAGERDAVLASDAFLIASHHQSQERSLRNVGFQRLFLNGVDDVLSDDWALTHSVNASFRREARLLVLVGLD